MKRALCSGLWSLALLAGCSTPSAVADLAENQDLYQDTGYVTKLPGDRSAFVAPLRDARRTDVLPAGLAGYPIVYDPDSRWDVPVTEMLDTVLRRELEQSGLFAAIEPQPAAADLVVEPSLVTFLTAQMELESGGRAIAEVALRLRVHGPADDEGDREVLLDEVYGDRQVTDAAIRTVVRYVLASRTTHFAMRSMLSGLDAANVGRSGMPIGPLTADDDAAPAPVEGLRPLEQDLLPDRR